MNALADEGFVRPVILPLGDSALLVRFAEALDDLANKRTLQFAQALSRDPIAGVVEVVPSLVSVLVRYDPVQVDPVRLAGELGLRMSGTPVANAGQTHRIEVRFGGGDGPDLDEVAAMLGYSANTFIARHNAAPLRVLTTGFAPGFVYCGFHEDGMTVPRRTVVRPLVPAGSVLFAAGQTAIAATDIPTGWHVIGRTEFRNFDPAQVPPTRLVAGDLIAFGSL
jgi:5-oxoprolinase (ATP-hydrolysing) subunit B